MSTENAIARPGDLGDTVAAMVAAKRDEIGASLAAGVDLDRLTRVVVAQIRKSPQLQQCTAVSLARSLSEAAALGVEPGLMGQAYLVPYGGECTLIVGYRGLIEMARRSGEIAKIEARTVHENDDFRIIYGDGATFQHSPDLFGDRGAMKGVYAEATYRDGTVQRDFMTSGEVDAIRNRSRAGSSGPWQTDYAEMAKKTVVRRLCKMLPLAIATQEALTRADAAEWGEGGIQYAQTVQRPRPALLQSPPIEVEAEAQEVDSGDAG